VYVGKTLFAQVMEFVPWTSFARIVQRHGGNSGVRTLSCAEQFRAMAFAQLTWRDSLRDIEASLSADAGKLHAMGFLSAVKRSTLADANEPRDWRIWSNLAAVLIRRARKLYAGDAVFGVDLDNTVCALDSSTIDVCLSQEHISHPGRERRFRKIVLRVGRSFPRVARHGDVLARVRRGLVHFDSHGRVSASAD